MTESSDWKALPEGKWVQAKDNLGQPLNTWMWKSGPYRALTFPSHFHEGWYWKTWGFGGTFQGPARSRLSAYHAVKRSLEALGGLV